MFSLLRTHFWVTPSFVTLPFSRLIWNLPGVWATNSDKSGKNLPDWKGLFGKGPRMEVTWVRSHTKVKLQSKDSLRRHSFSRLAKDKLGPQSTHWGRGGGVQTRSLVMGQFALCAWADCFDANPPAFIIERKLKKYNRASIHWPPVFRTHSPSRQENLY